MLDGIGRPATLTVRTAPTVDAYGNDVPGTHAVELRNVFVYTGGGELAGGIGEWLSSSTDATALLPMGTAALLDAEVGHHDLTGATLAQDGVTWRVKGTPLPYPEGTSPYSWDWKVPLEEAVG